MIRRVIPLAHALILLAGLVFLYRLVVLPIQCSHELLPVEAQTKYALTRASGQEARRIARSNLERLRKILAGCETDVDVYLLLAFNSKILDRRDDALNYLRDGLNVDNRPELHFQRGVVLLEMGRLDDAIADFTSAARFSPRYIAELSADLQALVAAKLAQTPTGQLK